MARDIPREVKAGEVVSAAWLNSIVAYLRYLNEQQLRRRILRGVGYQAKESAGGTSLTIDKQAIARICSDDLDVHRNEDFQLRIENNQDDSFKLHKSLVERLEKKLKELEEREVKQWEDQYNPEVAMPQEIFKKLNQKLLVEKEEIQKALLKAKDSMPKQIDYREELRKFEDAIDALEDPEVDAKIKNQFLREIIDKIEYERGPTVRVTSENAEKYEIDLTQGTQWHTTPYHIKMKLKYR